MNNTQRTSSYELNPIPGFSDTFDPETLNRDYIEAEISQLARSRGWKKYDPPTLERVGTYDEEMDTMSGWAGFTVKDDGFIPLRIPNLENSNTFDDAVLAPEGTAPVCRVLAKNILEDGYDDFCSRLPMKLFYVMQCFRNEKISTLSETKGREFGQIGFEYIGSEDVNSDIEVIEMAYDSLKMIEVPEDYVTVRVGDVRIFKSLTKGMPDTRNNEYDRTMYDKKALQKYLDSMSTLRARTGLADEDIQDAIRKRLSPYATQGIIDFVCGIPNINDLSKTEEVICEDMIPQTLEIVRTLSSTGKNVILDPAVTRGWSYYSGPVFQIDVKCGDDIYPEIAGGGRYDDLVGDYLKRCGLDINVPATGFAFGTERVMTVSRKYTKPGKKTVVFDLSGGWE